MGRAQELTVAQGRALLGVPSPRSRPMPAPRRRAPRLTEDQLQRRIIDAATAFGWLVQHSRPARTERGWRTPVEGHAGFPDLVLVRRGQLLVLELKSDTGRVSTEQARWLVELATVPGITVRLVRPRDWPELEALLR